jgi:hypothetical protein
MITAGNAPRLAVNVPMLVMSITKKSLRHNQCVARVTPGFESA